MAYTTFPNSAFVYILDDIPGQGEFQGTGVIIGPHTVLTAAHLLYDADTGASADAVSLYPGFAPDPTTYNPAGAVGGVQSIHFIKVPDGGDELSAVGSESDFAVIDTSADLTPYGRFALDPNFTSGDVVVSGYPASANGSLTGTEGTVHQDGTLSDLDTSGLPLSPGYSGGALHDKVERDGSLVDAVVGTVSTNDDAMKLTRAKVALIRHWIASDQSLYAGGLDAPRGLIPQIAGTVSGGVDAARVAAPAGTATLAAVSARFAYDDGAAGHAWPRHAEHGHVVHRDVADLVNALRAPLGGGEAVASAATEAGGILVPPAHGGHRHGRITAGA